VFGQPKNYPVAPPMGHSAYRSAMAIVAIPEAPPWFRGTGLAGIVHSTNNM
jgi:hypothetical protein